MTSEPVLEELAAGPADRSPNWLALLAGVPVVPVTRAVADIVSVFIRRRLMPNDPTGDPPHVALASFHRCDYLATWNCRHLADARKFAHLRRVSSELELLVPALVTPLERLGEAADDSA